MREIRTYGWKRGRRSGRHGGILRHCLPKGAAPATARPTAQPDRALLYSGASTTWPAVLPSSRTSRTAPALNSSGNRRRGRRSFVVLAIVDIVSAFRKASTKPDQAQVAAAGAEWADDEPVAKSQAASASIKWHRIPCDRVILLV